MSLTKEEVMRRAQKLMQFTAGNATTAELELAAERLGKLLRENNLSAEQVEAEAMKEQILEDSVGVKFRRPPSWFMRLATVITIATSTRWLRSRRDGAYTLTFIGTPADAQVASYFFQVCVRLLPEIAKLERPFDRKAFLYGMADGVGRRLLAMVRPPEMTQGERGLMVVKDNAIKAYMEEKHATAKPLNQPQTINDRGSYHQGVAAAEAVPLNHGIGHARSTAPRIAMGA